MASCTAIDGLTQAYIDGELGQSERVILEQHVSECPACAATLRRQQRASAHLFEAFGEQRLSRDLRRPVLENLPEIDPIDVDTDVEGLNWRAKHPVDRWRRAGRFVPAAAVAIVALMALVLHHYWPAQLPSTDAIGIVTQATGAVTKIAAGGVVPETVSLRQFVAPAEHYMTGPGSTLMLALPGKTAVKMNESTRVKVESDRNIAVEEGRIWLEIGKDGRAFKVLTPSGKITVYGTAFDVHVAPDRTVVTVENGQVTVDNDDTETFRVLEGGQQVDLVAGERPSVPKTVDVKRTTAWARRIEPVVPQVEAENILKKIMAANTPAELPGEQGYIIIAMGTPVKALCFTWQPDRRSTPRCSYDIYVFDDKMDALFKERIPASVFAGRQTAYRVVVPESPIRNVNVLHVQLVPDISTGRAETSFKGVSAIPM